MLMDLSFAMIAIGYSRVVRMKEKTILYTSLYM